MGGVLSVVNDRVNDFDVELANIFALGQGICVQRLGPIRSSQFKFDHNLADGSWYDIQIIDRHHSLSAAPTATTEVQRYLKKGIYLKRGKTITMSELICEENLDHGAGWTCGTCKQTNISSLAICEHYYTNKSQTLIDTLSYIPIIGAPFSIANAVLQCGKAAQSHTTAYQVDATVSVLFAAVDLIAAPILIKALIEVPAKVAAKTIFCEGRKPLLRAAGKELIKGDIAIKATKLGIKKLMK